MSSPASYLHPEQLRSDLGIRDLSDPAEGPHAIQLLIDRAVARLSRAWGCEVRWCRGPRIVPVADALGADACRVEEVEVLSATAYEQLPTAAIGRLGAKPGQRNLLLRVVLRDLEKTLTNEAANVLRDRIYRALHQGTEYQWAR